VTSILVAQGCALDSMVTPALITSSAAAAAITVCALADEVAKASTGEGTPQMVFSPVVDARCEANIPIGIREETFVT
jgi:hypothetical protein